MFMKTVFQHAFVAASDEALSIDSMMLKAFKVDPRALPKSYLNKTMRLDEFSQAVELIVEKLEHVRPYEDKFSNYDAYFEYMKKKAISITETCHHHGFYSTHEIDRFTCACIANKMKLPLIDVTAREDRVFLSAV